MLKYNKNLIELQEIADVVYLLIHKKTNYISGDEIIIIRGKKTSHMKYLYNYITNKDEKLKIKLEDIINLSLINYIEINNK